MAKQSSVRLCLGDPRGFWRYMFGHFRHKWQPCDGKVSIPSPISSGTFFTFGSLVTAGFAFYFYTSRNADRNCSAAESRNLNEECMFMDFFDNHDLWHFFSGAMLFAAFLTLLVVDDNLMLKPRKDIPVI